MNARHALFFGAGMFLIAGAGSANAGVISTPIIFLGQGTQLICIGSNISAVPVTMTVKIIGQSTTVTQTCTLAASDTDGCQNFLNGQSGQCRISIAGVSSDTVRARVRGVLFNRITVSPFSIFNTLEAR